MALPKRVEERIISNLKDIQRKIDKAKELDISEAQTVSGIIKPILVDILGYDEFEDLTDQYAVRGTFCDLAVKANGKPFIMIEAKAINVQLKEAHAKQAKDYGLNSGVQWIILTNGIEWNLYKIIFKQPITEELVMSFNVLDLNLKKDSDKMKLFYLCKEAISKSEIDDLYTNKVATNKFIVGNLLLKEESIKFIRRELRKMFPDADIQPNTITEILTRDIIKREILETPEAIDAQKQIGRVERKEKKRDVKILEKTESSETTVPLMNENALCTTQMI